MGVRAARLGLAIWLGVLGAVAAASPVAHADDEGPTLSILPARGVPGGQVMLAAEGFLPNAPLSVYIDGIAVPNSFLRPANPTADKSGVFLIMLTVPTTPMLYQTPGDVEIDVTDDYNWAWGMFTVLPRAITLSPKQGPPGALVVIQGSGWRSGAAVDVDFQSTALGTATAGPTGSFAASFRVPTGFTSGGWTVTATDRTGLPMPMTAATVFTIGGGTVEAKPSQVAAGARTLLQGSGFPPFTTVTAVTIGGISVLPSQALRTDANGSFIVAVTVPFLSKGPAIVQVVVGMPSYLTITVQAAPMALPAAAVLEPLIDYTNPAQSILRIAWAQDPTTGALTFFAPGLASTMGPIQTGSVLYLNLARPAKLRISGRDPVLVPAGGRWLPIGEPPTIEVVS